MLAPLERVLREITVAKGRGPPLPIPKRAAPARSGRLRTPDTAPQERRRPETNVTTPNDSRRPTFGYLLVVEDDRYGFTGGLLVVCEKGRPLEFHCTEPVLPSRAEQILFGPTLRGYVCGDQIGGALISKAKLPIACLLTLDEAAAQAGRSADIETFVLSEAATLPEALQPLAEAIDPVEPFERVREAIREAQRLDAGGDQRAAA